MAHKILTAEEFAAQRLRGFGGSEDRTDDPVACDFAAKWRTDKRPLMQAFKAYAETLGAESWEYRAELYDTFCAGWMARPD